jgi:hypothetical protein
MASQVSSQVFDRERFFRSLARMARHLDALVIWCLYEHPSDYPQQWVARACLLDCSSARPVRNALLADSLEELRGLLPRGLYRVDREPLDDPCLREVWL